MPRFLPFAVAALTVLSAPAAAQDHGHEGGGRGHEGGGGHQGGGAPGAGHEGGGHEGGGQPGGGQPGGPRPGGAGNPGARGGERPAAPAQPARVGGDFSRPGNGGPGHGGGDIGRPGGPGGNYARPGGGDYGRGGPGDNYGRPGDNYGHGGPGGNYGRPGNGGDFRPSGWRAPAGYWHGNSWGRAPLGWGGYHYPGGYGYRRWSPGLFLPALFFSSDYYFNDYGSVGLYAPSYGYHWIRYGPDLLLVQSGTRRIVDVRYGVFR